MLPIIVIMAAIMSPRSVAGQEVWNCLSSKECRSGGGEEKSCETGSFPFEFRISADGGSSNMSLPEQELNLPLVSTTNRTRTFAAKVDEIQFSIALGDDGAMKAIRSNRYRYEMAASCSRATN